MSKPGRKPRPTHLKLVEGNPGKRALNKREPKPRGDLLDPPDWLTESQKAGWTYAIANAPAGLLKRLDRAVLVIWVVAEDLHRQASQKLEASNAMLIKSAGGTPLQSPFIGVLNKQAQIMLKAAAELGFSPASRSRVEVEPGAGDDEGDEYFG